MANLARYESFAVDNAGNVLPSPSVEVRLESTGALASLFSGRTGTGALPNPFTGDSDGAFGFHVVGGAYKITVTKDAVTRIRRYVAIGTAAEFDGSGAASGEIFASTFGVVGDGSTDDTFNLQTAIDNTPAGGTLRLPQGLCNVIGSGSACLTRSTPIQIKGSGWASGIIAHSSVPNTRDILAITVGASQLGFKFQDFMFGNNSSARHCLKVDGGAFPVVYNIHVDNLLCFPTAGGNSIFGTGATGGVFAYSTIKKSNLESIAIDSAGDGLSISDNVITGDLHTLINVTQVSGAGNLVINKNVLAGNKGMITVGRSSHLVVDANEMELQSALSQTHGALVDFDGGTGQIITSKFTNNIVNISTGSGVTSMLRLGNCSDAQVHGNHLGAIGSVNHVETTSNCIDANIYGNECRVSGAKVGMKLLDAGKRTSLLMPEHILTLAADQTGSNVNTSQVWFPGGGDTGITVLANTAYFFEGVLVLHRTAGTTSHFTSLELEGTATISSMRATYDGITDTTNGVPVGVPTAGGNGSTASGMLVGGTNSSATEDNMFRIKGIVRFSGAGTFIPKFKFSSAPGGAPTVRANSEFRMKFIGPDTVLGVGFK